MMFQTKARSRAALVLFFVTLLLELYLVTFLKGRFGNIKTPVIWFAVGFLNAFLGWRLATIFFQNEKKENTQLVDNERLMPWIGWLAFSCGLIFVYFLLQKIYTIDAPDGNVLSDIIPAKKEYIRRLLAGELVYRPIHFEGYDMQPNYMPLRWMPYLIAQFGGFDYRWVSFLVFAAGLAFFVKKEIEKPQPAWELVLKCAAPFFAVWFFAINDPLQLGLGIELLMVGFYLLLAATVLHQKTWLMAFGLIVTCLSRWSVLFWLPFILVVIWQERSLRTAFRVGLAIAAAVVFGYLLPFCRHDFGQNFLTGLQYYLDSCFQEWKVQKWQADGSEPFTISRGVGFSFAFYKWAPGDLWAKYMLNARVGPALSTLWGVVSLAVYWFWVRKEGSLSVRFFALASLKVFMLVFTGFVFCPYSYLFEVPFFLSFPLLFGISMEKAWRFERDLE